MQTILGITMPVDKNKSNSVVKNMSLVNIKESFWKVFS